MLNRSFDDSKNSTNLTVTQHHTIVVSWILLWGLDPWHLDPSGSPKTFKVCHCICPNITNKHRLVFLLSLSGSSSSPKNTSIIQHKTWQKREIKFWSIRNYMVHSKLYQEKQEIMPWPCVFHAMALAKTRLGLQLGAFPVKLPVKSHRKLLAVPCKAMRRNEHVLYNLPKDGEGVEPTQKSVKISLFTVPSCGAVDKPTAMVPYCAMKMYEWHQFYRTLENLCSELHHFTKSQTPIRSEAWRVVLHSMITNARGVQLLEPKPFFPYKSHPNPVATAINLKSYWSLAMTLCITVHDLQHPLHYMRRGHLSPPDCLTCHWFNFRTRYWRESGGPQSDWWVNLYIGLPPFAVIVTTRIITFLVGV